MSTEKKASHAVDPEGKWLYRVGAICALLLGIAYLITIALYAHVGAPPSSGVAWLTYLAGKTTEWWAILGLSVFTDLLYIPVAFALYLALQGIARSAMLVATACVGLFVVLDLAVTWTNCASLIMLNGPYAAASTEAQRMADIAAANYASAVLASRLETVYAIVILSCGILLISLVMLKGLFNKMTAAVGLITGVLGIVSIAGWAVTIILTAVFATLWLLLVGYRLYRLSQQQSTSALQREGTRPRSPLRQVGAEH